MLILSRQINESIVIGENIVVTIVDIRGDKVRFGINCQAEITVHRGEVFDAITRSPVSQRLEGTVEPSLAKPIQPQETQYQQFVKYLQEEDFNMAGRIYIGPGRDFEASHPELDKLSKGLYALIQRR